MSQWARNNPEKVGSDPRTHLPGYGSLANYNANGDELCPHGKAVGEGCPPCAAAYAKRIANALAGAATLAENDRQAAELSRYIEAKAEILKMLKEDRRDWWDNNMTGISWLHERLIAHIEGREPRRTNYRDDREGA